MLYCCLGHLAVISTVARAGNFNGRESDDVVGRDGRRYLDVEDLGASWSLNGDCDRHHAPRSRRRRPSAGDNRAVAAKAGHSRPTCVSGASMDDIRRRCSVLKSSTFQRCRQRVDVVHYYQ